MNNSKFTNNYCTIKVYKWKIFINRILNFPNNQQVKKLSDTNHGCV